MKDQKRTWFRVFIALLILLPGLPYLLIFLGLVLRPFGLQGNLFVPALILHNVYFTFPALLFGKGLYPAEEFGYLPSASGYAVAAVLYGLIALGLSFPISTGIHRLRIKRDEGQQTSGDSSTRADTGLEPPQK